MYDSMIVEMVNVWKYVEGKWNRGLERRCCKVMCRNVPLPQVCFSSTCSVVSASGDFEGDVPRRVWLYWFCMYDSKSVYE
jgi:hypothetical protein